MTHALFIDGQWRSGAGRATQAVRDPATDAVVGELPHATPQDLDEALHAAERANGVWRATPAIERARILRGAAAHLRAHAEDITRNITQEQGKALHESRGEAGIGAETLEWYAEEARRLDGRLIPPRTGGVRQMALRVPVGPVAALCAWNAPLGNPVRKLAPALAAGCPVILKASEETPGGAIALVRALQEAGIPRGVVNLVFGEPATVAATLLASPVIRKISFTGSTQVGKWLAARAGETLKHATLELGGHAPVLVFEDADLQGVAELAVRAKLRNAGQICFSPTRFLVHERIYERFLQEFVARARAVRVGNGFDDGVEVGALANPRRLDAMEQFVADAHARGLRIATGGGRIGTRGCFWEPTVVAEAHDDALISTVEPFGPIAAFSPFGSFDEAVVRANRLPYGLAAYVFTRSIATARDAAEALEVGNLCVNHFQAVLPETPFGGVKDSGIGREGGAEGIAPYLETKFISER